NRTGRSGEDLLLQVPPGTVAVDADTNVQLGELITPGDTLVVAKGGRGGRGNARFASPTHQAPRKWEPGEEGEQRVVRLELKLLADVGLVGEPNAGKSTLLSRVSRAKPKVADYPFTTLTPNLGVVELPDYRSFVMADIPGLIEGAHEGKGLGHQFLKHIERTRVLVIMLPLDVEDLQAAFETLRGELGQYSQALAELPYCIAVSKTDLLPPDEEAPGVDAPEAWAHFAVSSATGRGLPELLEGCWKQLEASKSAEGDQDDEW
ncbi:MAG: GTPase ObgE, partial [Longimicrobiales bacterium]